MEDTRPRPPMEIMPTPTPIPPSPPLIID